MRDHLGGFAAPAASPSLYVTVAAHRTSLGLLAGQRRTAAA
jgi:hypothetical protein